MSKSAIVNGLTFGRVPLIFAWLVFAVLQEFTITPTSPGSITLGALASLMMLLSGLTDLWDGQLARKWNVVSTLGKMADPLMDKIFYLVAFPELIWQLMRQGESETHALVMLLFTILYMLRDTWVNFMRMVAAKYNADVAAMWLGKVRTALSFPGAGWVYLYCCFHRYYPSWLDAFWLAGCYLVEAVLAILTVWSLITYSRAYWPYFKKALERD